MIIALKVRLEPNKKQKTKLLQSAGVARWAYNWTLAKQEENYKNGGKFINDGDLRKEITLLNRPKNISGLIITAITDCPPYFGQKLTNA